MLGMVLYGIGVMYTPGPINILGLNLGINKKFKLSIGYFLGVGMAMLVLFLVYGYTGERIIKKEYLLYISIVGSAYIIYLAFKIFKSTIHSSGKVEKSETNLLSFKDGLIMHIMNPKATLATLPIAIIHFPANHINGLKIFITSFLLAILAAGAPGSYSFVGQIFGNRITNGRILNVFNIIMSLLLFYVAGSIIYDHIYLVLTGVNEY